MLTTLFEIYEALNDMNIEITCSEEGEEWFWRNIDTSEEGQHSYANGDEAAIAAAAEFGIEHTVDLDDEEDFDSDPYFDYDDMDGDHASALASAGFGTDEDYGYFGGDDY